jgi:hypothetical protein
VQAIPARQIVYAKPEIQSTLMESMEAVCVWIESQPTTQFVWRPEGRWTMGQHLDHLVRSVKPVNLGLSLPKFIVRLGLGTSGRTSMLYGDLTSKYEKALDDGGKASGRYLPPAVGVGQRDGLLAQHRGERDRLVRLLDRWTEADLDHFAAPHPLLGKVTLRELLFFTIHHHDHHLQTLQHDYAAH